MGVIEHKADAPPCIGCMVITVSDTRTEDTDKSGKLIRELLAAAGHRVTGYQIVKDEREKIAAAVAEGGRRAGVDVILVNGGTGISSRDTTLEAVKPLLDKELPGFGELFRYLSFAEDIGSAAMLSRAIAGTHQGRAVFVMPGSTGAVRLAMTRLILPELGHVVRELRR